MQGMKLAHRQIQPYFLVMNVNCLPPSLIQQFQIPIQEINEKPKKKYGTGYEANSVKRELGSFDAKSSEAYKELTNRFSKDVTLDALKQVANILRQRKCDKLPPITRNAKRSLSLLIKWYQDNWNEIRNDLQYINIIAKPC